MAELRTEEEQLEALKKWWDENGKSIVAAIVIAFVAYGGYNLWSKQTQSSGEAASALYEDFSSALRSVEQQTGNPEESQTSATNIARQLIEEHDSSSYAGFAALYLGRQALEADDPEAAIKHFRWVLEQHSEGGLYFIAKLRLARVLIDQGEGQQALDELQGLTDPGYDSVLAEVRGDAYYAMDQLAEARSAYEAARDAAESPSALLQMKLDNLTVSRGE